MTRREKAFKLFEDGKVPTSPEVKKLGLKSKTRANYYLIWKRNIEALKAVKGNQASARGEFIGGVDETKKKRVEANPDGDKEIEEAKPEPEEVKPEEDIKPEEAKPEPEEAKPEKPKGQDDLPP